MSNHGSPPFSLDQDAQIPALTSCGSCDRVAWVTTGKFSESLWQFSDPHVAWSNMVSEMWSSHHLRWDT